MPELTRPLKFHGAYVGPPLPRDSNAGGCPDWQNLRLTPDQTRLMPLPGYRRSYPFPLRVGLLGNPHFTTDTVWIKGGGWTISEGQAHGSAAGGNLAQAVTLVVGRRYTVDFSIRGYVSGSVQAKLGTTLGAIRSADGDYSEVLLNDTTDGALTTPSAFTGSLDNAQLYPYDEAGIQIVSFPAEALLEHGNGIGLAAVDEITGRVLAIVHHPGGVGEDVKVAANRPPKLLGRINRQGPHDRVTMIHTAGKTHIISGYDEEHIFDGQRLRTAGIRSPQFAPEAVTIDAWMTIKYLVTQGGGADPAIAIVLDGVTPANNRIIFYSDFAGGPTKDTNVNALGAVAGEISFTADSVTTYKEVAAIIDAADDWIAFRTTGVSDTEKMYDAGDGLLVAEIAADSTNGRRVSAQHGGNVVHKYFTPTLDGSEDPWVKTASGDTFYQGTGDYGLDLSGTFPSPDATANGHMTFWHFQTGSERFIERVDAEDLCYHVLAASKFLYTEQKRLRMDLFASFNLWDDKSYYATEEEPLLLLVLDQTVDFTGVIGGGAGSARIEIPILADRPPGWGWWQVDQDISTWHPGNAWEYKTVGWAFARVLPLGDSGDGYGVSWDNVRFVGPKNIETGGLDKDESHQFAFSFVNENGLMESHPSPVSNGIHFNDGPHDMYLDVSGVNRGDMDVGQANGVPLDVYDTSGDRTLSQTTAIAIWINELSWGVEVTDPSTPVFRLLGIFPWPEINWAGGNDYRRLIRFANDKDAALLLLERRPPVWHDTPWPAQIATLHNERLIRANVPEYRVGECATTDDSFVVTRQLAYLDLSTAMVDFYASDPGTGYERVPEKTPQWGPWLEGREIVTGTDLIGYTIVKAMANASGIYDRLYVQRNKMDGGILPHDTTNTSIAYRVTGHPTTIWPSVNTAQSGPEFEWGNINIRVPLTMPGDEIMALTTVGSFLEVIGRKEALTLVQQEGVVEDFETGVPYPRKHPLQGGAGCVSGKTAVAVRNLAASGVPSESALWLSPEGRIVQATSGGIGIHSISKVFEGWLSNEFRVWQPDLDRAHAVYLPHLNWYVLFFVEAPLKPWPLWPTGQRAEAGNLITDGAFDQASAAPRLSPWSIDEPVAGTWTFAAGRAVRTTAATQSDSVYQPFVAEETEILDVAFELGGGVVFSAGFLEVSLNGGPSKSVVAPSEDPTGTYRLPVPSGTTDTFGLRFLYSGVLCSSTWLDNVRVQRAENLVKNYKCDQPGDWQIHWNAGGSSSAIIGQGIAISADAGFNVRVMTPVATIPGETYLLRLSTNIPVGDPDEITVEIGGGATANLDLTLTEQFVELVAGTGDQILAFRYKSNSGVTVFFQRNVALIRKGKLMGEGSWQEPFSQTHPGTERNLSQPPHRFGRALILDMDLNAIYPADGFPLTTAFAKSGGATKSGLLPTSAFATDEDGYVCRLMTADAFGQGAPIANVYFALSAVTNANGLDKLTLDSGWYPWPLPEENSQDVGTFFTGLGVVVAFADGTCETGTIVHNDDRIVWVEGLTTSPAAGDYVWLAPMESKVLFAERRLEYQASVHSLKMNVENEQSAEQAFTWDIYTPARGNMIADLRTIAATKTFPLQDLRDGKGQISAPANAGRALAYALSFRPMGGGNLSLGRIEVTESLHDDEEGISD